MKRLASDSKLTEMTVNDGALIRRSPDATFSVPDDVGRSLLRGSQFGRVGVNLRSAQGYRCQACGHLGVFRDKCRCGSDRLEAEA